MSAQTPSDAQFFDQVLLELVRATGVHAPLYTDAHAGDRFIKSVKNYAFTLQAVSRAIVDYRNEYHTWDPATRPTLTWPGDQLAILSSVLGPVVRSTYSDANADAETGTITHEVPEPVERPIPRPVRK